MGKSTSSRTNNNNNNNNNEAERRHPRQQQALYLTGMTQREEEEEEEEQQQQQSATNVNANTNSDSDRSSAQTRSPQRWKPSPPPPPQQQDTVCRAYHKLEEAFARYRYELPAGNELVALDCGSAPGGWTKFLLDYYQKETVTTTTAPVAPRLKKIYCIYPADMSPIVIAQPEVVHVRHKIDAALMQWEEEEEEEKNEGDESRTQIDIWVSDMCLHYVGSQIDTLLDALRRRRPIIARGTMFVLTIKCVVGHTKESFDNQVAEQRARIEDISRDVQTLHLFSNRSGERTLIGYI